MVGASAGATIGAVIFIVVVILAVIGIASSMGETVKKASQGQTRCESCGGNLLETGFGKLPETVGTCKHCGHVQSWVKSA